jgi:monoamine oxidase
VSNGKGSDVDVLVIGAGMAGLAVSKRLEQSGLQTLILEASHRIGGRAWTDDSVGVPFDLGAHWLHAGGINPLSALARANGFDYRCGRRVGCVRFADRWASGREILDRVRFFDRAFGAVERVGEAGTDVAVSEVLPTHPRWSKLLGGWIADVSGVEAQDASSLDFARYRDTKQDWPVRSGLGALVAFLGRDAPVRLGVAVEQVDWAGPGVRVVTQAGMLRARAVVITVSTGVLAADTIRFKPRLPAWKRDAIEGIPLGLLNKVLLRFDRDRLGVRPGRFAVYEPMAPRTMGFLLLPFGLPLAVGHVGGQLADELEQRGAAAMKEFAFETLRAMFGADVLLGVEAIATTAWRSDPFHLGAYSAARPGCGNQRTALARPIDRRLFFAGEACSIPYFSTVHGAYLSGLAAAEAVARAV